jgi:hypothetical protein
MIDNTYPGLPRDGKGNVVIKAWIPKHKMSKISRPVKHANFIICVLISPVVGLIVALFELFTQPFKWIAYAHKVIYRR